MNAESYQSLYVINAATQQITEQIESLKSNGLLTPHFADLHKLAAEQNCAEINLSTILKLAEHEQNEAATTEKERLALQAKLQSEM